MFDFNAPEPSRQAKANVNVFRGAVADPTDLIRFPPLPGTASELRQVAASVGTDTAALFFGRDATETKVRQSRLDQYRIVYFATHGFTTADVKRFAQLDHPEPALLLSVPDHPTDKDDGLLTASEVAQLELNADWVASPQLWALQPGQEMREGENPVAK